MLKMGVFWNETRQDLNKMVDMAKIGGQKDRPDAENGGQNCSAYLPTLKEPGPRLNIKTVLSRYGDSYVKDKTAVRTSYL